MKRMAALLVTIGICGCMSACNTESISFDVTNDVLETQISRSPITSTSERTTTTTGTESSTTTTTTTTRMTTTTRKTIQTTKPPQTTASTEIIETTTTAEPVLIKQHVLRGGYVHRLITGDNDPNTAAIRGYQVLSFLGGHYSVTIYHLGEIYVDKIPPDEVYDLAEKFFVLDDAMKESLKDTRYYNSDTDTYSRFSRHSAPEEPDATIECYKPLGDDCYEVYGHVYIRPDSICYKIKVKLTFDEEGYRESMIYLTAETISGKQMASARKTAYEYDPEAELKRE